MRICTFPDNSIGIFSEWVSYDSFTRLTGVTNQYLSGLAFVKDVAHDVYHWWGRCSNLSAYLHEEGRILLDVEWRVTASPGLQWLSVSA